jgi:hypothetical protein
VIGEVYNMPPQPPVPEHTRQIPAGVVTFGVEYRDVDPESLVATYADNPAHLAELAERSPEGGFSDEGISIHVCATDGGHEYVRFDVFDDDPHYHYVHNTAAGEAVINHVIGFDVVAHGDMLDWAIDRLRVRLPAMLTEAGGTDVAAALDPVTVAAAVDEVEVLARRARAAARSSSG